MLLELEGSHMALIKPIHNQKKKKEEKESNNNEIKIKYNSQSVSQSV